MIITQKKPIEELMALVADAKTVALVGCGSCATPCEHTPMEELTALMKYMVGHNAAHARELADLAKQLDNAGNHMAFEQVMAAVSDFEKGNLRLSAVLASMDVK